MPIFSNFREKLKVNTKTTKEKKYKLEDIQFRQNLETGKMRILLIKKPLIEFDTSDKMETHKYKRREVDIESSKMNIDYELEVSPSGHSSIRKYINPSKANQYSKPFLKTNLFEHLFGEKYKPEREYTKEELLELIKQINQEMGQLKYDQIREVEYTKSFRGERSLQGKHLAYGYNKKPYYDCIDDESIGLRVDEDNLVIIKDGQEETVKRSDFIYKKKLLDTAYSKSHAVINGYTLRAIKRMIEKNKEEIQH